MLFDWILFDADHTLFDFDRTAQESLHATLASHGVPHHDDHWPAYDRINKACWAAFEQGKIEREQMRTIRFTRFFEYLRFPGIDVSRFADDYLHGLPARPYLIDGARELISHFYGKVRLGIITNGLREVQRPRLVNTGFDRYFEVIVVSGEINLTKPDPRFFDYAHREMGRPEKGRVLVVGDSLVADIGGGAAYGFETCWYNPAGLRHDTEVNPRYVIADLNELPELVQLPWAG